MQFNKINLDINYSLKYGLNMTKFVFMRLTAKYQIHDIVKFKDQLLNWASNFDKTVVLSGENKPSNGIHLQYNYIVAVESLSEISVSKNCFSTLKKYQANINDWLFGYFTYDLKNEIEQLNSTNNDGLNFPELFFFQPKWVFLIIDNEVIIHFPKNIDRREVHLLFSKILKTKKNNVINDVSKINSTVEKKEYIDIVQKIKQHIQLGDIYELNYCKEFFAKNSIINPVNIFKKLYKISEAPFSCYFKANHFHVISSSPERFIKKNGLKIISQPIKGTRRRGKTKNEDLKLKNELFNCPKERSENVMVVDLVRNDLSKTASKSSVNVEELFGIYSFKQVHQMISTVSSEIDEKINPVDVIKECFPMASMTGTPKVKAMELIEKYEKTKRGLYSGSVGYFTPEGDFDFNVIIRSILYNSKNKYVSFMVGSAITSNSLPEFEYDECLLKAQAMFEVLEND